MTHTLLPARCEEHTRTQKEVQKQITPTDYFYVYSIFWAWISFCNHYSGCQVFHFTVKTHTVMDNNDDSHGNARGKKKTRCRENSHKQRQIEFESKTMFTRGKSQVTGKTIWIKQKHSIYSACFEKWFPPLMTVETLCVRFTLHTLLRGTQVQAPPFTAVSLLELCIF